jgi:hypothetical protein
MVEERSWARMIGRFVLLGLAAAATGCGDPQTSVYVKNDTQVPYVIRWVQESDGTSGYWLVRPMTRGVTLNIPGTTRGTVMLYTEGCRESVDGFNFPGGTVSVTVRDGAFVEKKAGLPQDPTTRQFSWTPECPATG